jgi:hypothetical protein
MALEIKISEDLIKLGFKKSSITSIYGSVPNESYQSDIDSIIAALEGNKEELGFLLRNGFTAANISSILNGSRKNSATAIAALVAAKDDLIELTKSAASGGAGFTATNISSILSGSRTNTAIASKALLAVKADLIELTKSAASGGAGFTADNISSMLGGSGANAASAIANLMAVKGDLIELTKSGADGGAGFTLTNISSMLGGSGAKAADAIKALVAVKADLIGLTYPITPGGTRFTAANISSILNVSGAKASDAIAALFAVKADLIELTNPITPGGTRFTAENISSILHKSRANAAIAVKALTAVKADLIELTKPKTSGGARLTATEISSLLHGSGAKVADAVKALANQDNEKILEARANKSRQNKKNKIADTATANATDTVSDRAAEPLEAYNFVGQNTNLTHENIMALSRFAFTDEAFDQTMTDEEYDEADPVKFAAYSGRDESLDNFLFSIVDEIIGNRKLTHVPIILCEGALERLSIGGREADQIVGNTHYTGLFITKHLDDEGKLVVTAEHMNSFGDSMPNAINRVFGQIRERSLVNIQDCVVNTGCAKQTDFHDCGDHAVYNLLNAYRATIDKAAIADKDAFVDHGREHLIEMFNGAAVPGFEGKDDLIAQVNKFLTLESPAVEKIKSMLELMGMLKEEKIAQQTIDSFFARVIGEYVTESFITAGTEKQEEQQKEFESLLEIGKPDSEYLKTLYDRVVGGNVVATEESESREAIKKFLARNFVVSDSESKLDKKYLPKSKKGDIDKPSSNPSKAQRASASATKKRSRE